MRSIVHLSCYLALFNTRKTEHNYITMEIIFRCFAYLIVFISLEVARASVFQSWYILGFSEPTLKSRLSLGSVDIKTISDDDLISMVKTIVPLQNRKSSQGLTLSFHLTHGLVNLLRHANRMHPFIQAHHHIIILSSCFKSSSIRRSFLPHYKPDWTHMRQLTVRLDTDELSHAMPSLSLFGTTYLERCNIFVDDKILFFTKKNRADAMLNNIKNTKETSLPDVECLTIYINVTNQDRSLFNFHNFPWLLVLLEKLDTKLFQFKFSHSNGMSLEDLPQQIGKFKLSLVNIMSQVWKVQEEEADKEMISFKKDTSQHIMLDNFLYIPATPFWKRHQAGHAKRIRDITQI